MKSIMGLVLIVIGILLGVWVGLWMMFIGGIIQIVNTLQCPIVEAMPIAIGVIRIMFSGFVGYIVTGIFFAIGSDLIED